jgi:hypothetical protein
MKFALILLLLPYISVYAEVNSFKTELAILVERAIKTVKLSQINISPEHTDTALEITSINGFPACDPKNKEVVILLQKEFSKSKDLRLTYSQFGAYLRENDSVKYLAPDSEALSKMLGKCSNLYVSVY